MSQTLRSIISAGDPVFGTTPGGKDWCIKALHPSDPLTEVRGIPDQSALPSLCMNYQSTFTLSPETAAVGTWGFDCSLIPHPVAFMSCNRLTSVGNTPSVLLNSQLEGATHAEKFFNFKRLAQRWRLAYMAVTIYQDGPDLANQGTLVVSQPPVSGRKRAVTAGRFFTEGGRFFETTPTECSPTLMEYTEEDLPNFTRSQAMPNAYFNRSREGAYVPLKLTETCQDWSSESDEIALAAFTPSDHQPRASGIYVLNSANSFLYPFTDLQNVRAVNGSLIGEATAAPLSGNWAHISARNLATTTSYSFFVRCGIEMQVSPSSTLSPQLKLSPPYDPTALSTYFAICRELKDAYPADYNTTGKLWAVIKQALNALDPVISVMPGARVARPLINAGVATGDILVARRKKRKQKKKQKKRGPQQQQQRQQQSTAPRRVVRLSVVRKPN